MREQKFNFIVDFCIELIKRVNEVNGCSQICFGEFDKGKLELILWEF